MASNDSLKARRELTVGDKSYVYYSLRAAEEAGLFAMGGLVDLIPDAFGPGGQPAEHTQREIHGRDTEDKKCAGDHADARSQQQGCQVAFTSFSGFKRACNSSLGIPFSSRRLRRLTEISFTCV